MQYLLLIYGSESSMKNATQADMNAMMAEYGEFTQSIVKSGHMKAGDALQPSSTATTGAAVPWSATFRQPWRFPPRPRKPFSGTRPGQS